MVKAYQLKGRDCHLSGSVTSGYGLRDRDCMDTWDADVHKRHTQPLTKGKPVGDPGNATTQTAGRGPPGCTGRRGRLQASVSREDSSRLGSTDHERVNGLTHEPPELKGGRDGSALSLESSLASLGS